MFMCTLRKGETSVIDFIIYVWLQLYNFLSTFSVTYGLGWLHLAAETCSFCWICRNKSCTSTDYVHIIA